jgi:hypothetical protein
VAKGGYGRGEGGGVLVVEEEEEGTLSSINTAKTEYVAHHR